MSSEQIRVLIVEDHKLTRIGLKAILKQVADIDVVGEAVNGQEAVDMVRETQPDVVLMDVGMPVMDGIEAVKIIHDQFKKVNTIMLTSHDNENDIVASLTSGACGYCLKDVDPERLFTAIRSVNEGDIWIDSSIAGKLMGYYALLESGSESKDSGSNKGQGEGHRAFETGGDSGGHAVNVEHHHYEGGDLPPLPDPLSPRELEVLNLIVEGNSNQQIADKLIISLATAKTHVRNILNKLAVDDRTQAAVQAMRRGLV